MPRTAHRTPTRNHPQKRPHAASSSTKDNRLHTVVDDRHHSYYAYDHTGERTLKVTGHSHQLDVNADLMHTAAGLDEFTLYPSPYLVFTNRGYTKHYYAGTERLAARIGGGFDRAILREQTDLAMTATHLFKQSQHHTNERHLNAPPAHTIRRDHLSENIYMAMMREFEIPMHLMANAVIKSSNLLSTAQNIVSDNTEPEVYFYHSDHLGSASWKKERFGKPFASERAEEARSGILHITITYVQHLQYLPYGEPYIDQRAAGTTYSERFRFTGKERDEETGYGYFGARYMDHELMTMWLSVDPMADKYPNISPYNYCMWNPVKLVDPNGMDTIKINLDEGSFMCIKADGDHNILYYKDEKVADCLPSIKKEECSFLVPEQPDRFYFVDNNTVEYCTYHLYCTNSEIGESIFKKIAKMGSPVEWNYFSIKMGHDNISYGDLSSSGIKDKVIHKSGQYSRINVNYWDHYHPNNHCESFYPSHDDQDLARELNGVNCTIYNNGRSMIFGNYVPSKKGAYINVSEFREIWNRFAK